MICKGCGKEFEPRHKRDYRCQDCYKKLGKRSKRKGNSNESRFVKKLQELFVKYDLKNHRVIRTPRSGAISQLEKADALFSVPNDSIFNQIHVELKDSYSWSIEEWYEKAFTGEKDTGKLRNPMLILRKPNGQQEYLVADPWFIFKLMIENEKLKNE